MPEGPRPDPPEGVARVAITGTLWSHPTVNVLYVDLTASGVITIDDLAALALGLSLEVEGEWLPVLTSDWTCQTIDIVFYKVGGGTLRYTLDVGNPGSLTGTIEDAAASYVVDWVISDSYRGGHPRSYLAGVHTAYIDNGSDFGGVNRATFAAAMADFLNAVNALTPGTITDVALGTVSFSTAGAWRDPPIFRPYTSVRVSPKLGSQRRRIRSS